MPDSRMTMKVEDDLAEQERPVFGEHLVEIPPQPIVG